MALTVTAQALSLSKNLLIGQAAPDLQSFALENSSSAFRVLSTFWQQQNKHIEKTAVSTNSLSTKECTIADVAPHSQKSCLFLK